MFPSRLRDRIPAGAHVVEVGVGGRFETACFLAKARPDLRITVTDVRPDAVAHAPATMRATRDDVTAPTPETYTDAFLLYAVRPGEEIQPALARLAASFGAWLAIVPLAGELVTLPALRPVGVWPDGAGRPWHVYAP